MKSAAQRLDRQESAINRCQTETNHWHAGVQHRGRGLHSSILLSGIHGTDASTHATRRTAGDSLPSAFFYSDLMGYRPDWRIIILFWFRPVTTHDCHPRSQAWTQSENRTPETNHTQTAALAAPLASGSTAVELAAAPQPVPLGIGGGSGGGGGCGEGGAVRHGEEAGQGVVWQLSSRQRALRNSGRALPGHLESAETVCPTFPGFVTFGAPTPLSKLKPPILVAQSGRYFRTLTLLLQILQDERM